MRAYTLKNYEDELNHQVIHMDQAVCYCPEYLATGCMHDYPSRKMQLARAVAKGELPLSDRIGEIVFSSILSRQGERWQNFRENPENMTDVMILSRGMLREKGFKYAGEEELNQTLNKYNGHVCEVTPWNLPKDSGSKQAILIDDLAAKGFKESEKVLDNYLKQNSITFVNDAKPVFVGFEYFACGMIREGKEQIQKVIDEFENYGVDTVCVISAQAKYMLTQFVKKLNIHPKFEVKYLADCMNSILTTEPVYVYGGSFNLRYLCNAEQLNTLVPNQKEERIKNSIEFIPLLKGDHRVNELTIWQKPLSAEYTLFGMDEDVIKKIEADAIEDIKKANPQSIISFEPSSMQILRKYFPNIKVAGYLDFL
ncbi:MAG: hypothetical protein DUD26_08220 [Eubacteriaceae bacterium]|uniref:Uncharacterized protein n=1 Tax=Candidatus Pseudoramibacter fermentans TaxID=2594427 RepID=A0A6L5GPV7_9FIRM|nr:hypothetical protein [Candidatus Pseudoramibacter fermentans]RRF92034.1 MAG: hypothetical protein DUD26_08220 [Eubacteriaceae bacterium]